MSEKRRECPSDLELAIDRLYAAFPAGMSRAAAGACPCCVGRSEAACIETTPRQHLEATDLTRYAFKAMSTWGTQEAYRYFLPRILELCVRDPDVGGLPGFDAGLIVRKLKYGNWTAWPETEQRAIVAFVTEWWRDPGRRCRLTRAGWLEDFVEPVLGDVGGQLAELNDDPSEEALERVLELVEWGTTSDQSQVAGWLRSSALESKLETHFEATKDESMAKRIGAALERLEYLKASVLVSESSR